MKESVQKNIANNTDFKGKDRKFKLAVFSITVMTLALVLVLNWPSMMSLFGELIGGILGINLIFNSGNVGAKFAVGKIFSNK